MIIAAMKAMSPSSSAAWKVSYLLSVATGLLLLISRYRPLSPLIITWFVSTIIPPALWSCLIIFKREDREFLLRASKSLSLLRWLFWVPGTLGCMAAAVMEYRWRFLSIGVGSSMVSASIVCNMIQAWTKKQCGIEEPSSEDWWPAKPD